MAPILSRHRSETYFNEALFARVEALKADEAKLGLDEEQSRVLDRYHLNFTRTGAGLAADRKARLAEIGERLASLGAQFGQNVLADEKAFLLLLEADDLAGLPDLLVAAAARTAAERGHPGKYGITLSRSSIEPFLQFSARRDLREKAFRAWVARGENGGATDNRADRRRDRQPARRAGAAAGLSPASPISASPTRWRRRREAALDLLRVGMGAGARARAGGGGGAAGDRRRRGRQFRAAPWDWRYYAEKRRKAAVRSRRGRDQALSAAGEDDRGGVPRREPAVRPVASSSATTSTLYHQDARAWTVSDAGGATIALFIGDYFARPSKRSGAWMSALRDQQRLDGGDLADHRQCDEFRQAAARASRAC